MRRRDARKEREPTIALINIVFLMLIFFLVAGTIAPPLDTDLKLVRTADIDTSALSDALVVHENGDMTHKGKAVTSADNYIAPLKDEARATVRIIPDRNLPAETLVRIGRELRAAGAGRVLIVTERGL
ncbi:biopolymer transport protein ExbD [Thalassococcus halodurans]|uniref:Biopolymer transport protein ExbD n=1 Tax=Thalassococcus halodurans TaxID=373675 RepID=A0A1H5WGZ7_9RHOB|nr:biopolymer transporter ExbD [Thalassococcus halodurans]SEF98610.1 biopolymer transport protein ExbD [Thalassococcus halodurans]